jgi:hypothetical protein
VADFFGKMEFDPEVTGRTLGKAYTHLTPDVYIDSVKKLLAVHKGAAGDAGVISTRRGNREENAIRRRNY